MACRRLRQFQETILDARTRRPATRLSRHLTVAPELWNRWGGEPREAPRTHLFITLRDRLLHYELYALSAQRLSAGLSSGASGPGHLALANH